MKKIIFVIAILTLLLSFSAVAEVESIDFDGNFENMVFDGNLLYSPVPNGLDVSTEDVKWNFSVDEIVQGRQSYRSRKDEFVIDTSFYADIRTRAIALFGEPICEYGDGKTISLVMPRMQDGDQLKDVIITGEVESETQYGVTTIKTAEVLDGCVFVFYVQNQPTILHMAYMHHEETPDSDKVKPKSYDSVDLRFTAIDVDQYNAALTQAGMEGQGEKRGLAASGANR